MNKLPKLDQLPIDLIDISVSNVRKEKLREKIDDLARNIDENGLLQPVVVYQTDGRYELIIGQRRYLACKKLGWSKILALISDVEDETDALVKSFTENIHRLDLEYRDKMRVAAELLNKLGSVQAVSERLGVTVPTVKNYLGYAAVPEAIKTLVDDSKISASTALRISRKIPDEDRATRIAGLVSEEPIGRNRGVLVDVAAENPRRPIQEVAQLARDRAQMKTITVHVTQRIFEAVASASKQYQSEKEDVVQEALEDWLRKRGFVE